MAAGSALRVTIPRETSNDRLDGKPACLLRKFRQYRPHDRRHDHVPELVLALHLRSGTAFSSTSPSPPFIGLRDCLRQKSD
jgi:hypothetical protein